MTNNRQDRTRRQIETVEGIFGSSRRAVLSELPGDPRQLNGIAELDLSNSNVSDLSVLEGLTIFYLDAQNTMVEDLRPLYSSQMVYLNITGSRVRDLRPILNMRSVISSHSFDADARIDFENIPACADTEIAAASIIEDPHERKVALLDHLRTLPPWPEPLEPPPEPADSSQIQAPEQDSTLPLIWGERGFRFFASEVETDPIVDASIEALREILETLIRKGNAHDDIYARASKMLDLLDQDELKALPLHYQYQFFLRLRARAEIRTDPFDDETITALDHLQDIVPGITLADPQVQELIARQDKELANRTFGIHAAREVAVLDRILEPDAPFEDDVREVAEAARDPDATDRLSGLRSLLSRNALIAVLRWGAKNAANGIVGGAAIAGVNWIITNRAALMSLADSVGHDAYWWALRVVENLSAILEKTDFGL